MFYVFKIYAIFSVFFLFLTSCKEEEVKVNSGVAQLYTSVFSKRCNEGSINIRAKRISGLINTGLEKLNVGDKVQISGTIKSSLCGLTGNVGFSCTAQLAIANNRSFVCQSGNINSFGGHALNRNSVSTLGTNSINTLGANSVGSYNSSLRKITKGEFFIYNNGTAVYSHLLLDNHSNFIQQSCPVSFKCE
ncbi:MAG: hypothetical protein GDA46_02860 [Bdellovibrionales bacterium]|nr:hypothetical protein [Bdellovibrionales bacterium]